MRSKHATQGWPVALSRQITQDNGQLLRGILLLGAGWAVTMDLPDAPARDRLALLASGLPELVALRRPVSKAVTLGAMTAPLVYTLPGWLGSGPEHWQSRWETRHGCLRVEQHDWQRPLRGDWSARLQDVLLASPPERPVLLAAHSLGCLLVAWWAAHAPQVATRVRGALLVAPPDIERPDLREQIPGWAPPARQRLPFPAVLVASSDDPYGALPTASRLAADWGAALYSLGPRGHVNADSGLGDWDEGWALLQGLARGEALTTPRR